MIQLQWITVRSEYRAGTAHTSDWPYRATALKTLRSSSTNTQPYLKDLRPVNRIEAPRLRRE